jgi:hypothetical protein
MLDSGGAIDNELPKDIIPDPARSAAIPGGPIENAQSNDLPSLPMSFATSVVNDLTERAQSGGLVPLDQPELAGPAALHGGATEVAEDSPMPSRPSEALLADLLPSDLASLELDLQAFLEQIERLGGELMSLLGRMNLSAWLVTAAVAAVAGEIARRQLQARRGPLLVTGEDATFAWFPGLTGPESW